MGPGGVTLSKPKREPGAAWPAILIGLFVAFGGVLYGYDTGTINGIIEMVGAAPARLICHPPLLIQVISPVCRTIGKTPLAPATATPPEH